MKTIVPVLKPQVLLPDDFQVRRSKTLDPSAGVFLLNRFRGLKNLCVLSIDGHGVFNVGFHTVRTMRVVLFVKSAPEIAWTH